MVSHEESIWVVVANSNICRIYNYSKINKHIQLLKELNHPENKLKDIDLTSDKPGRYQSSQSAHGAYSQATDPKEIKIDHFSKEVAQQLDHGRNLHEYKKLIIIISPHMYGLILNNINSHVKNLISHTFEKDLINLNQSELLEFLKIHTKYPHEN